MIWEGQVFRYVIFSKVWLMSWYWNRLFRYSRLPSGWGIPSALLMIREPDRKTCDRDKDGRCQAQPFASFSLRLAPAQAVTLEDGTSYFPSPSLSASTFENFVLVAGARVPLRPSQRILL